MVSDPWDTTDNSSECSLSTCDEATEEIKHMISYAMQLEWPEIPGHLFLEIFFDDVGEVREIL